MDEDSNLNGPHRVAINENSGVNWLMQAVLIETLQGWRVIALKTGLSGSLY